MYGGGRIVEVLVDFLNIRVEDWIRGLVVPLYMDGDVELIGNYRGISLGCCVAKVFTRLLEVRIVL